LIPAQAREALKDPGRHAKIVVKFD